MASVELAEEKIEKLNEIVADAPLAVELSEELVELEEGSEVLKKLIPATVIGSSTF